jgi:hypothetical protein
MLYGERAVNGVASGLEAHKSSKVIIFLRLYYRNSG